jgi:hypothetical protein
MFGSYFLGPMGNSDPTDFITTKTNRNPFDTSPLVMSDLRGVQLFGYLEGTIPKSSSMLTIAKDHKTELEVDYLAHVAWATQDQQVLGFLRSGARPSCVADRKSIASLLHGFLGEDVFYEVVVRL